MMPTREELLLAADELENSAEGSEDGKTLRRVARWLREQAEEVNDVTVD
jgi:hypothetical protein